jgi:N-glycosyltransferase
MRVLSTVTGSVGHAHEILPMVRALVAAGHHVVVAPSPHLAPVFAGTGAEVVDAMPDFLASTEHLRTLRTTGFPGYEPDGGPVDPRIELIAFAAGPQVTTAYEALLPIAEELRPDLVYREGSELAGCLIAEKLGIPHITGPTGVGNVLDPAGLNLLLNERRKDVGLPEKDDAWSMYPNGWLDSLPVGFSFAQYVMP